MMATGFLELMLIVIGPFGMGDRPVDLASLIDPVDYFNSRNIKVTPENMLQVAGKDAEGHIRRLLAIRWLSDHPQQLKKSLQPAKSLLAKLSKGKEGFVRDHAEIALAKLEGKQVPLLHIRPRASIRSGAMQWFPKNVTLLGAFDFRRTPRLRPDDKTQKNINDIINKFLSALPPIVKQEVYRFADQVGNIRLDRVAFAFDFSGQNAGNEEIYFRLTGKVDSKRFVKFIRNVWAGTIVKTKKTPNGQPMTIIHQPNQAPVFAFIGDSELIICGYDRNQGNHLQLLDKMQEVMAGKQAGVLQGFKQLNELKKTPANARGVLIGELEDKIRRDLRREIFGVAVESVVVRILPAIDAKKGIEIDARGVMESEKDAKTLVKNVQKHIQQGLAALKQLENKLKPETVQTLRNALKAISIKANQKQVRIRAHINTEIQSAMVDLFHQFMKQFGP